MLNHVVLAGNLGSDPEVRQLDFQPIAAFTVVVGVMVAFVNLGMDLLYGLFDPRIRH